MIITVIAGMFTTINTALGILLTRWRSSSSSTPPPAPAHEDA